MGDNVTQGAVLNGYVAMNESKPQTVILKGYVNINDDRLQATSLKGTVTVPEVVRVSGISDTIILVDDYGNEVIAVLSNEPVNLDATPNDIRIGKTAATNYGVTLGEKEIPAYYVDEGYALITDGSEFKFRSSYNGYTKLQAFTCKFNSTIPNSVYTDKVSINGEVYETNSTEVISYVYVNSDDRSICFGIRNDTSTLYILRYFMYKEIY